MATRPPARFRGFHRGFLVLTLSLGACAHAELGPPEEDPAPTDRAPGPDPTPTTTLPAPTPPAPTTPPTEMPPPTTTPPAGAGSAAEFDGAKSYLHVARHIQDDFTIELWIKTTASARANAKDWWAGTPIVYADVPHDARDFGLVVLNDKLAFGATDGYVVTSTTSVSTGAWVHVALVRDRAHNQMQIYVDGRADGSGASPNVPLDAPAVLQIGRTASNAGHYDGLMDELRIWSVARSAADIAANKSKRLVGNEPGLVGYFRFDEPDKRAKDLSSTADDAVVDPGDEPSYPTRIPSTAF